MPWAGQTWLQLYQETAYGTFAPAGSLCSPRLYQGNSFTVRKVPQRQVIRTADAGNRPIQVVANRMVYTGTLNTLLYPTQAGYWATALSLLTGPPPDVPSYSATYWDSVQAWKLLGGKIQSFTITSSAQQDYIPISLNWIFQTRDTTFTTYPAPAESVYPTETPYQYVESASNITLGGSAVTKYKTVNVTVGNVLAGTWDELPYISSLLYCGRDMTFSFGPQYLATTYRSDFENQTALAFVLEWIRGPSSAHTLTFNCESSSYVSSIGDDLPLDGAGYQTVDVQVFFDKTATTDFTMVAT
jgi:hypothetical protein